MRKFLLLPVFAMLLAACSNDFDVTAPWKEIPVVYAILSAQDSLNYVRIEKAFLDPEKGADVVAKISDSIYYPADAISVFLERVSTQGRVQLQRVDGNLEGIVREPGTFATSPNWLYKLVAPAGASLFPGEKYKLIIQRTDGQQDVTATTTIPAPFVFSVPSPSNIPPKINFATDKSTSVKWRSDVNGAYFNLTLNVKYREEAANGTVLLRRTISWPAGKNIPRDNIVTNVGGADFYTTNFDLEGNDFFQLMSDSLAPISDRFRYFDGCDIILEGGGAEIAEYLSTVQANSGITGSEILTTYTNLSEGFGIFTSKSTSRLINLKIEGQTVDQMNDNPLTKLLNFRK